MDNFDVKYLPSGNSWSVWSTQRLNELGDRIFSGAMVRVRKWAVADGTKNGNGLGTGFADDRNMSVFDGTTSWISQGSVAGSVHGAFINTTETFAD